MSKAFLFIASAFLLLPLTKADVIYTSGFENPAFQTGSLNGQDGWSTFGTGAYVEGLFHSSGQRGVALPPLSFAYRDTTIDLTTASTVTVSADFLIPRVSLPLIFFAYGGGLPGGLVFTPGGSVYIGTSGLPAVNNAYSTGWNHFDITFDYLSQSFDVAVNGLGIYNDAPFLTPVGSQFAGAGFSSDGLNFIDNYQVRGSEPIGRIHGSRTGNVRYRCRGFGGIVGVHAPPVIPREASVTESRSERNRPRRTRLATATRPARRTS